MSVQWFSTPLPSLRRLSEKGPVYFSTLGSHNFQEWRAVLNSLHFQHAGLIIPDWVQDFEGDLQEIYFKKNYGSGLCFLKTLKKTGATVPSPSYLRLKPTELKQAIKMFDKLYQGSISWHIIYGRLPKYQAPL